MQEIMIEITHGETKIAEMEDCTIIATVDDKRAKRINVGKRIARDRAIMVGSFVLTAIVTLVVAMISISYAYSKRGEYGVGSEWVLVFLAAFATQISSEYLLRKLFDREAKKQEQRRSAEWRDVQDATAC